MWLDAIKFLMQNYSILGRRQERVFHTDLEGCYLPRLEKLALLITNTRIIEESPLSAESGDFRRLELSPGTIQRLRSLLGEVSR